MDITNLVSASVGASLEAVMHAPVGILFAVLGMALAILLPGIGSAKNVGLIGEAASGLLIEESEKFGKSLVLQLMAASQGLYGFVIFIMAIGLLHVEMTVMNGLYVFVSCLPIAIVGWPTASYQGKISVAGIGVLSRNEAQMTKSIIYAVMVETYALLGFVSSLIMLNAVSF
jgi:ATP synthase subunit C.